MVRLKVSCLRLASVTGREKGAVLSDARSYLDQAFRYALRFGRPTLWITCGLPASGKSAQARGICEALMMEKIRSDAVRKEMFPKEAGHAAAFGQGIYRDRMRDRVYARMLAMAQDRLRAGESVLLDATFSRKKWRAAARLLAHDLDVNLICVECTCREETLKNRLIRREKKTGLSDARLPHLSKMQEAFEPVKDLPETLHLRVDTDRDYQKNLNFVLSRGYALKCRQVEHLL